MYPETFSLSINIYKQKQPSMKRDKADHYTPSQYQNLKDQAADRKPAMEQREKWWIGFHMDDKRNQQK